MSELVPSVDPDRDLQIALQQGPRRSLQSLVPVSTRECIGAVVRNVGDRAVLLLCGRTAIV